MSLQSAKKATTTFIGLVCSAGLSALGGCTVGQDFQKPLTHMPSAWPVSVTPDALVTTSAAPAAWWRLFNDPVLNELIEKGVVANLDLKAAIYRMDESRALVADAESALYPTSKISASYARDRISSAGLMGLSGVIGGGLFSGAGLVPKDGIPPFSIFSAGIDTSWELDLWGKVRRSVEASRADYLERSEDLKNAMVTVTAEIGSAYIDMRASQALLDHAIERERLTGDICHMIEERARKGLVREGETAAAKEEVARMRARRFDLEQQVLVNRHRIALLLALPPDALDARLISAPVPQLPSSLPTGFPSDLLKQRPDIRAREARLHAAFARIGVAKAEFFPSLTLTGNFGFQALDAAGLYNWASRAYTIGPSVSLPLFQGGKLRARLEIRTQQEKQAANDYEKTVLQAIHEVVNAIAETESRHLRVNTVKEACADAAVSLALESSRYHRGLASYPDMASAHRGVLDAQDDETAAMADAAKSVVTLYKALGGGWRK